MPVRLLTVFFPSDGPNTCSARALIRLLALPVVTGAWVRDEFFSGGEMSIGTSFS